MRLPDEIGYFARRDVIALIQSAFDET